MKEQNKEFGFERPGVPARRVQIFGELYGTYLSAVLLAVVFFGNFSARLMVGPLLPAMEKQMGIGHLESGIFVLMTSAGVFFGQISAAFIAGWRGYRFCIQASLFCAAAAAAMIALFRAPGALYPCFVVIGLTGGLYVPAGIALITSLFHHRNWGKSLSIHELAPNLALILVPFLAMSAIHNGSWRTAYLMVSGLLFLLAIAYTLLGVDALQRPHPPTMAHFRSIAANRGFWLMAMLISLGVGLETGVYSMVPLFLVNERAYSLSEANYLLGLSRLPCLAMVLLSGWITDRLGSGATICMSLGLSGAAIVLMGAGPENLAAPAIVVQGAATACLFPPVLAAAAAASTAQGRALSLSFSLAIALIVGGGVLPAAIAWAGETVSFGAGLTATGVMTMAGIGLVPCLTRR